MMIKRLIPAVISGLLASFQALAAEQQVNVNVGALTCPSCSFIVASSIRGVPTTGIIDFKEGLEWDQGIYVVTYDDQITNPEMIIEAIMAIGFPARTLPEGGS